MPITINNGNSPQSDSDFVETSDKVKFHGNAPFKRLPIVFIPNSGQTHPKVRFQSRMAGLGVFLTQKEITLSFIQKPSDEEQPDISHLNSVNKGMALTADTTLHGMAIALRPIDANPNVEIKSMYQGTGKVNFLKGNNPQKWHTDLPTYRKIVYKNLWEGINLNLYEESGQLKYEFIVNPGASYRSIRLSYDGMDDLYLDDKGNLVIDTSLVKFVDKCPESYQMIHGRKVPIRSGFILRKQPDGKYVHDFKIGREYNSDYPLIIDPGIYYSTYLGGTSDEYGYGIAVDNSGSAYVTGQTYSSNFPTTPGAYDTSFNGGTADAFVTKLSPNGSTLSYSTFLGGGRDDRGNGIAVDTSGSAYVTGSTNSGNFPTTPGAYDRSYNGGTGITVDAFIAKLSPDGGTLGYSTFLGGSDNDIGTGIAVDSLGSAYVTGYTYSSNFPTTPGAYDRSYNGGLTDAFVSKLSSDGSILVYSSYLGGSPIEGEPVTGNDAGYGIAVDSSGNAYVTGETSSSDFPTTPGAYDTSYNFYQEDGYVVYGYDVFVSKFATTPQGQISVLIAEIQTLVRQGVLNRGQGTALISALDAALRQLNRGNCSRAINQLNLFITRVTAFSRAGILTQSQSQELISEAARTIEFINYLCSGSSSGSGSNSGLREALVEARADKVQDLINNLGSSDYFTSAASTEELGRRIKEEPGSVSE